MISHLVLRHFRGVSRELSLSLGRITLFSGRNALGKTTVFDALDWCIFGPSWRLGDEKSATRNLYEPNLPPYVAITLEQDGSETRIERTEDGATLNGSKLSDRDLVISLVNDPDLLQPYLRDIAGPIRRLIYLPQSDIRAFVTSTDSDDRRAFFHMLLGVPHAATVDSTIRRVSERITERREILQERLDAVATQLRELSPPAQPPDSRLAQHYTRAIGTARSLIGEPAQGVHAPGALLNLLLEAAHQAKQKKISLQRFKAFLVEANIRRGGITREVAQAKEDVSASDKRVDQLKHAHATAEADQQAAESAFAAANQIFHETEARARTARDISSLIREVARSEQDLAACRDSALLATEELARLQRRLHEVEGQVDAATVALESDRGTLNRINARESKQQLILDLASRQRDVQARLNFQKDSLSTLRHQYSHLEEHRSTALQSFQDLEQQYRLLVERAHTYQRLTSMLAEAARLATELKLVNCPLCGQTYASNFDLLEHIHSAASSRIPETEELLRQRSQLDRARADLAAKEGELNATRSRLEMLSSQERNLSVELHTIDTQLQQLTDQGAETLDTTQKQDLMERLTEHERAALTAANDLSRTRAAARSAESKLEQLRVELVELERKLGLLRSALPATASNLTLEAAEKDLRAAEAEHISARTRKSRAEMNRQNSLARCAEASQFLEEAQAARTQANARLASHLDQLSSIERDVRARAAAFSASPAEDPSVIADSHLTTVDQQEAELDRASSELGALLSYVRSEEAARHAETLRVSEADLMDQIQAVHRAQARFDSISALLRARSEAEASLALRKYQAAIQEAFRALYPHRHLDRTELLPVTGEILVSDAYLKGGVRPELFASTGQLNILALAVFLGIALNQPVSKLDFLLLDEPVQNLDDVHFLAFITLTKRLALRGQVILSTADTNIAELITRQMRSTWAKKGNHYVEYEWRGFDPKLGPEVVRAHPPTVSRSVGPEIAGLA